MDPIIDTAFFSNCKRGNADTKNKRNGIKYKWSEFKAYRREILTLTKELLNKKNDDTDINDSFNEFIYDAIEYLKFKEKKTQIQNEYADLSLNKKSTHCLNTQPDTLLNNTEIPNMLMYKDYNLKTVSMDNFVKKTQTNPHIKMNKLPTQRVIKHKNIEQKRTISNTVANTITDTNTKTNTKTNKKDNKKKNMIDQKEKKEVKKKKNIKKTMKIDL